MDIGFGFSSGLNQVNKRKVLAWLHRDTINWKAFLWYISQHIEIVDFTANDMTVRLVSSRQREHLYRKVLDYCDQIEESNYDVSQTNDLWKSHHRNGGTSENVLKKILS